MKLYVGNLSFQSTESELREVFGEFGEVTDLTLITDRETGRLKGFGFVEFSDDAAANAAIEALDGKELGGRTIKVNEARPKTERPRRGGGGGGGGSGRRDRW